MMVTRSLFRKSTNSESKHLGNLMNPTEGNDRFQTRDCRILWKHITQNQLKLCGGVALLSHRMLRWKKCHNIMSPWNLGSLIRVLFLLIAYPRLRAVRWKGTDLFGKLQVLSLVLEHGIEFHMNWKRIVFQHFQWFLNAKMIRFFVHGTIEHWPVDHKARKSLRLMGIDGQRYGSRSQSQRHPKGFFAQ